MYSFHRSVVRKKKQQFKNIIRNVLKSHSITTSYSFPFILFYFFFLWKNNSCRSTNNTKRLLSEKNGENFQEYFPKKKKIRSKR